MIFQNSSSFLTFLIFNCFLLLLNLDLMWKCLSCSHSFFNNNNFFSFCVIYSFFILNFLLCNNPTQYKQVYFKLFIIQNQRYNINFCEENNSFMNFAVTVDLANDARTKCTQNFQFNMFYYICSTDTGVDSWDFRLIGSSTNLFATNSVNFCQCFFIGL